MVRIVHYIVFDLEWNQSPKGKEGTVDHLPFEIIEIGAVKLDEGQISYLNSPTCSSPERRLALSFSTTNQGEVSRAFAGTVINRL